MLLRSTVLAALALVLGCGGDDRPLGTNPEPQSCRTVATSGLSVTVWDDALLQALCDAVVLASSDTHFEQVMAQGSGEYCGYVGLFEQPGTYHVTASHPGYAPAFSKVTIGTADCHVVSEHLEFRLFPVR